MTIKIPENLIKICNDNTIKAVGMLDNVSELNENNFDELENFYQAKLFIQKLKIDCWILCRNIWEKVWENQIKDKPISYISELWDLSEDANNISTFCVSYKINNKFELNLFILLVWKDYKIYIGADINDEDGTEYALTSSTMQYTEKKEFSTTVGESYNRSKFGISLKDNIEINDDLISGLNKARDEIISNFYKNKEIIVKGITS